MRNLTGLSACAWLWLIFVTGCSKNGSDVGPAVDADQVVGAWQITQLTADPAVVSPTYGSTTDVLALYQRNIGKDCVGPTRYVFSADSKLQLTTSADCQNRLTSIFGFTTASWRTSGQELRIEGVYDALSYTVTQQNAQTMVWQQTEYNSPIDGKIHQYRITLSKR
jgi:hypothetical protein